jgi:hypothetical protein
MNKLTCKIECETRIAACAMQGAQVGYTGIPTRVPICIGNPRRTEIVDVRACVVNDYPVSEIRIRTRHVEVVRRQLGRENSR